MTSTHPEGTKPGGEGASRRVELLDVVAGEPCPKCGSPAWIVDGHPPNRTAWLLCLDLHHTGCVETQPLPAGLTIIDYEE